MIMQISKTETILLIIINVLPLVGLFALKMRPIDLSLLFIIETLIGFFFFEIKVCLKICKGIINNLFWAIFIIPHFVLFSFMQIMLSCLFFETRNNQIYFLEAFEVVSGSIDRNIQWIALIFIYHFIYLFYYIKNRWFEKDESRSISKSIEYLAQRLMIMQFTVLIGWMIWIISNSSVIGISTLIILQMCINLRHYFHSVRKTLPLRTIHNSMSITE